MVTRRKCIQVDAPGGVEQLRMRTFDVPPIGPSDLLVEHTAIGVNFIDVYHRTGLYARARPFVPGVEAAGIVAETGSQTRLQKGDRVGYVGPYSAYSTHAVVPEERLVEIPDDVSDDVVAGCLLQGLTAYALLTQVHQVSSGDTIMVHAAAGGVGIILTQWAASLGAKVIGGVSTPEKVALVNSRGINPALITVGNDWVSQVQQLTEGRGVDVVYDSVGRDTFTGSLDVLAKRGVLVSFGQSSGSPDPVDVVDLGQRGSLTVTRPSVFDFIATDRDLANAAESLFAAIRAGRFEPLIAQTYRLDDVASAHKDLESRKTVGSLILRP